MLMPICDNDDNMIEPEIYVDLAAAVEASETANIGPDGTAVNKNTTRLEILKTGAWNTVKGKFTLAANDLGQMVENFASDVRPHSSTHGLPIDEEHSKQAALGWLKNPTVEANDKGGHSLFMDAEWTRAGLAKIKDGTYKFFSPEVHFQHDDPEGTLPKLRNVLMGGGVTNRPLFKGLAGIPALTASDGTADPDNKIYINDKENNTVPTLADVRAKEVADLTEEDRTILTAGKDQLNEQERQKFFPPEAPQTPVNGETVTTGTGAATTPVAPVPGVTASEGKTVTLDASEVATLQANAAAGLEASEKLKHNEAEREVTEMFFSESVGLKLPTDMKAETTTLWLNASEDERATLKKIADNSKPMIDANDTREAGTASGAGQGNAQSILDDKVNELQASDTYKNQGYGAVLKAARAQNPDLAKEADAEIAAEMPQLANR
jgi:hypothetical protein